MLQFISNQYIPDTDRLTMTINFEQYPSKSHNGLLTCSSPVRVSQAVGKISCSSDMQVTSQFLGNPWLVE